MPKEKVPPNLTSANFQNLLSPALFGKFAELALGALTAVQIPESAISCSGKSRIFAGASVPQFRAQANPEDLPRHQIRDSVLKQILEICQGTESAISCSGKS